MCGRADIDNDPFIPSIALLLRLYPQPECLEQTKPESACSFTLTFCSFQGPTHFCQFVSLFSALVPGMAVICVHGAEILAK